MGAFQGWTVVTVRDISVQLLFVYLVLSPQLNKPQYWFSSNLMTSSWYSTVEQQTDMSHIHSASPIDRDGIVRCYVHNLPVAVRTSRTAGNPNRWAHFTIQFGDCLTMNSGSQFFCCPKDMGDPERCKFFRNFFSLLINICSINSLIGQCGWTTLCCKKRNLCCRSPDPYPPHLMPPNVKEPPKPDHLVSIPLWPPTKEAFLLNLPPQQRPSPPLLRNVWRSCKTQYLNRFHQPRSLHSHLKPGWQVSHHP